MTITNKTSVPLYISGEMLSPNETRNFYEAGFYTTNIHSEVGSCVITTEYGKRIYIRNFGSLVAKELSRKDEEKRKEVVVEYKD